LSVLKNKLLLILSFGHFAADFYASFMSLVWPLLVGPLGLTYGLVGIASTVYTIASSLAQPIFGYLGDRFASRFLAALGLAWIAIFMGLIGFVGSYPILLLVVAMIGLGPAAFHPQGAMNAAIVSGRQKASGMSIFSLGGIIAFSLGPLVGSWLFTTALGLKSTILLVVPGLLAALWLYRSMLVIEQRKEAAAEARTNVSSAKINLLGLVALIGVISLRAWVFSATTTYIPLLYQSRDLPLTFSGRLLFLMLLAGAVGVFTGGLLADRFGRRRITALSLFLLAPVTYLFYQSPMVLVPITGMIFGFLGETSLPITVVMGQEMMPRYVGVVSGLIYGLAFVTGGLGVSLTGVMADRWGLLPALSLLSALPLAAATLCLPLPKDA
jgi:FSR family fosmidomycin resistance protein-like MFS transporter